MTLASEPIPDDPTDPGYLQRLDAEEAFWATTPLDIEQTDALVPPGLQVYYDERHTGVAGRSWFADLVTRRPGGRAAMLGATSGYYEQRWLSAPETGELHVYDLSGSVLRAARERVAPGVRERMTTEQADFNFVELPERSFDVVFAVSCLHHLVRLESLFAQIERALVPGGVFAFYEYVGEPRLQFTPRRLEASRQALQRIPRRFWKSPDTRVQNQPLSSFSPFEAVRADEIAPLARARFAEVHYGDAAVLTPLLFNLDLARFREAPDVVVDTMIQQERELVARGMSGCTAYGVYECRP